MYSRQGRFVSPFWISTLLLDRNSVLDTVVDHHHTIRIIYTVYKAVYFIALYARIDSSSSVADYDIITAG